MKGDFDEDEFEDYELRPGLDYGDTVVDAERTFDLDEASPLERGLYNLCREVEQLPASALQTRLSLALSTAMIEVWRMRQRLASVAANEGERLRSLSDALTGGNAATWDEVLDAAVNRGSHEHMD